MHLVLYSRFSTGEMYAGENVNYRAVVEPMILFSVSFAVVKYGSVHCIPKPVDGMVGKILCIVHCTSIIINNKYCSIALPCKRFCSQLKLFFFETNFQLATAAAIEMDEKKKIPNADK